MTASLFKLKTLQNVLNVLNNVVVWMVSTRSLISKSSCPFKNLLVTVPKTLVTIGLIFTLTFHSFFNSLARLWYLSFFSLSFSFILLSAGEAKSTLLLLLLLLSKRIELILIHCLFVSHARLNKQEK